jgi:prevent-host-death family protein
MPVKIGLREANQQFSNVMRAVRGGEEVILTERGRPFAIIALLRPQTALERFARAGLIRPAAKTGALPSARPVSARGRRAAQILSDQRDER